MGLRILCYHEIMGDLADQFSSQLSYFRQTGCQIMPFTKAIQNLDLNCLAVTFDDGDRTVCEVAQPILDRQGIKAMLYLNTDYVIKGSTYNSKHPLPTPTWDQLGLWLEAGHEIGSHTHTHRNMTTCSEQQALEELETSRMLIRKELGLEVTHFAYPWGQHNARTRDFFAQDASWTTVATIERGINTNTTDYLQLKRDVINPTMGLNYIRFLFAYSQSNIYSWQSKLWRTCRSLSKNR